MYRLRPLVVAGASMRLVPLVGLVLLLASGPVFAQQDARTAAPADCPPGEPDTLQISWIQPCDSGGWLFDTQAGCRMWDWHPAPDDSVVWRGACHGHLPNGQGEAQWFEHGRPIDRFIGAFRNGKRDGEGHYIWNPNVRFDGNYANDVPQGYASRVLKTKFWPANGTRAASVRAGRSQPSACRAHPAAGITASGWKKSLSAELALVLASEIYQRINPPVSTSRGAARIAAASPSSSLVPKASAGQRHTVVWQPATSGRPL